MPNDRFSLFALQSLGRDINFNANRSMHQRWFNAYDCFSIYECVCELYVILSCYIASISEGR